MSDLDAWLDRQLVDARPRPGAIRDILADPPDD
jgi:hypothetical protein